MLAPGARPRPPTRPGGEVGQDVAEQVGGDDHVELVRVHHQLHAGVVDDHLLGRDLGVLRRDLARHLEEQARGGLHDVGLVHHRDLAATKAPGQLEGVAHDALAAAPGDLDDRLRGLAVGRQGLAFRAIGALGVLAHGDEVHAFVARARAGDADRRAHVGVEVEAPAQLDVDRAEALAHRRGQRALERDAVAADGLEGGGGDQLAAALPGGEAGVDELVLQAALQCIEHAQGGVHDLGADAVAADHCNGLGHGSWVAAGLALARSARRVTADYPASAPVRPAGRQWPLRASNRAPDSS